MHRVFTPGVAAEDTLDAEVDTFKNAPFFNGANHIGRTGGLVTAFLPQHRRKGVLVNADGEDKNLFEQPHGEKT